MYLCENVMLYELTGNVIFIIKNIKQHSAFCVAMWQRSRNVESSKTKHNIKDLLLKYEDINVEASKICVLCVGKLYSLHENARAFYSFCEASYKLNIHQTKRMAYSASQRLSKRKTIAEFPPQSL